MKLNFFLGFLGFILFGGEAMRAADLRIESPAFPNKNAIPAQYSWDGKNLSPPLLWNDPPERTKSFALIADDPDAPMKVWVHWLGYNIPPQARGLLEGLAPQEEFSSGMKQGITDFGRVGYGGPCPPPENPHRYFFKWIRPRFLQQCRGM